MKTAQITIFKTKDRKCFDGIIMLDKIGEFCQIKVEYSPNLTNRQVISYGKKRAKKLARQYSAKSWEIKII